MKKHRLTSEGNSVTIFVPYSPPSRNQVDGGTLRQRMRYKREARAAWWSASSGYGTELSMMITLLARANICGTPSPQPSASMTATNASAGNTHNNPRKA